MKLTEIVYPVYKLGSIEPVRDGGISFFRKLKKDDNEVVETKLYLDNKNMLGNTLSIRRLHLKCGGINLYKLKTAVFFLADLLKLADSKTWFIDSAGHIFKYVKTRSVKLVFKKIDAIIPIKSGGALLEIEGIAARYKCLAKPSEYKKYAGMLEIEKGSYILYGTYEEPPKNSRRKI